AIAAGLSRNRRDGWHRCTEGVAETIVDSSFLQSVEVTRGRGRPPPDRARYFIPSLLPVKRLRRQPTSKRLRGGRDFHRARLPRRLPAVATVAMIELVSAAPAAV